MFPHYSTPGVLHTHSAVVANRQEKDLSSPLTSPFYRLSMDLTCVTYIVIHHSATTNLLVTSPGLCWRRQQFCQYRKCSQCPRLILLLPIPPATRRCHPCKSSRVSLTHFLSKQQLFEILVLQSHNFRFLRHLRHYIHAEILLIGPSMPMKPIRCK